MNRLKLFSSTIGKQSVFFSQDTLLKEAFTGLLSFKVWYLQVKLLAV